MRRWSGSVGSAALAGMVLTLWPQIGVAGSVYVNGVNVDGLRGQTFERATVTIDASGNILIDAPGYRIEVEGGTPPAPPTGTTGVTVPAGTTGATAPAGTTGTTGATVPAGTTGVTVPAGATGATAPAGATVSAGRWWMVTEDNASVGHTVDVVVNGVVVKTVRSGEGQQILDLGPWLRPGPNNIRMASTSAGAAGGAFYVYIASGSNESGTVVINAPEIQYGLGATRQGAYGREYTLQVP